MKRAKATQNYWAQEGLILDVSETIWEEIEKQGITLTELANRMGRCKAHLSRMLRGDRNMTLRNCADILAALGKEAKIKLIPLTEEPNIGRPRKQEPHK